jgi:hypothetical protein
MEEMWVDTSPHVTFLRKLMNNRVDELVNSQEWLKRMRYRHDEVRWWQKRAGDIFEERGINLYQLIAQAHGECWDDEDEEKNATAQAAGLPPPRPGGAEKIDPPMLKEKPRQTACPPPGSPTSNRCTLPEKRKTPLTPTDKQ